ncbi:MAG: prenyltransferase, partial [Candidatus Gastranaerophilales bacterium]|nr:prenyltransferase [Candidatus Gastranaerophilales bacterium]
GICLAHLATNLFDDYIDYHKLKHVTDENDMITLPNTQRGKCRYLLEGSVTLSDVLKVVITYSLMALFIGLFFCFAVGKIVLLFMGLGAVIVLLYPFMSNIRLSELGVALCYGPLLFGGTYYVMTGNLGVEPFILSIPTMIFTVNLLFTDTFMDREIDKNEGKKTLCGAFKSPHSALKFQKWLLILGYLSVFLVGIFDIADWEIFLTFITIPLAVDLIKSLNLYIDNNEDLPEKKWFHFPFEDWDDIKENRSVIFMFRMYQARNLMIYFAILLAISVYFD